MNYQNCDLSNVRFISSMSYEVQIWDMDVGLHNMRIKITYLYMFLSIMDMHEWELTCRLEITIW